MKKALLVCFSLLLYLTANSQSWTNVGITQLNEASPYPFIYYEIFDLNNYTGNLSAELEILVVADANYHFHSRHSLFISRHRYTDSSRLDGVSLNHISGKPGLLEVFVFNNKILIRSTQRWGNIKYRRVYDYQYGNWTIPLTASTTRPSGALVVATQPFYYDFDAGVKHEYPSLTVGGSVGIGTSSPDAKLTVKGQIHAQEVKVDLAGAVAPDFVFEEDYALRDLKELEGYITLNKHLPEIPSAKEMDKNGLELKRMNLKLLQKIEELTLYLIEQNKKSSQLEEAVNGLREENLKQELEIRDLRKTNR